jgi:hypothetical protein
MTSVSEQERKSREFRIVRANLRDKNRVFLSGLLMENDGFL